MYTVIHLLVVDVSCVLVWDHAHSLGPKQNTRNIYHKQTNNGVRVVIWNIGLSEGNFSHLENSHPRLPVVGEYH